MSSIQIKRLQIMHKERLLVDCHFEIHRSLALVGESGSGKSLILKTLLGLCDQSLDIVVEKHASFGWIRGESVALVPQNPFTALSPLTKIKDQMFVSSLQSKELFEWLELDLALLERYPSELSGGQLQRVVVAMALGSKPSLLLLDEPTTALDAESTKVMIELLKSLQKKLAFSLLFVTHNMQVAGSLCDDICVLKQGHIIEQGTFASVLADPKTEYTRRLIDADFKNREYRK